MSDFIYGPRLGKHVQDNFACK